MYKESADDWKLWRDVYEGGQDFIELYLEKFARESNEDFVSRKKLSYNPAFAAEAVNEIKNSIFQRLTDISRVGGSKTYSTAVLGLSGGVDLLGSSMNTFIGREVLPELLTMSKVGIYVDMPADVGYTLADATNKHPYVYVYQVEDLRSWDYDDDYSLNEFKTVLLRDSVLEYDKDTKLPVGRVERYKRLWLEGGKVYAQYYDASGGKIFATGEKAAGSGEEAIVALNINRIPFMVADIGKSLLADVAKYQVALLNLVSSDLSYAVYSNFPFYTEQFDPRVDMGFAQTGGSVVDTGVTGPIEVKLGTKRGRRYPKGMERPGFIHPSSEPLQISMEKEEQMKREIRQLVALAVTNLDPKMASAESKAADNAGLESGLSYIGLELQRIERKIAEFWAMYEKTDPATVNYPETYDIKSREDKQKEAEALAALLPRVPSSTYHKALHRRIAYLLVGRDVSASDLRKIDSEIKNANGLTSNYEELKSDVEVGLCDLETASQLRGYPKGSVAKAAKEHAERLARIAIAQTPPDNSDHSGVRGVTDTQDKPGENASAEKKESTDTTKDGTVGTKQRGSDSGTRKTPVRE